jgi:hypothetical protein
MKKHVRWMWVTAMTQHEKLLDKYQKKLSENYFSEGYLSDQRHINNLIEWTDFYRTNLDRFATHYLGLKLYEYQRLMLYELGNAQDTTVIASRAAAKSYVIAIFACCEAILRPRSQIVIAAGTLKQSKLIVSQKIERELMPLSPNLRREIAKIRTHGDEIEVVFKNNSTILVVVGNDNARGNRSTILVLDEYRQLKKVIIDSVLTQFQHVRNAPYKDRPEYKDLEPEESKTVQLSSAWYRSHWMWQGIKDSAAHVAAGDKRFALLAFSYEICLYHKLKTRSQIARDKRRMDPALFDMEYGAVMCGTGENAYYDYELLASAQTWKQPPIYPRQKIDDPPPKKGSCLPHQKGEIRILSVDLSFVTRDGNDNTIASIIRCFPEHPDDNTVMYRKVVSYMESQQGGDTAAQARRIKELFYDTECDYVVLDTRSGGIGVYDMLARPTYDDGAGVEMPAWRCMNDENTANRVRVEGAQDVLFAVVATSKLNSDIAQLMRREFVDGRVSLLIPYDMATDEVLPKIKAYTDSVDMETTMFYEAPYIETAAFINESVSLRYDRLQDTGIIRISEVGNMTKDRFTSVSYGLYFASLLERDLMSISNQYDYQCMLN